ncbi:LEAF RUST 10 DISEASE-RESISTANCE LOCUS RECEPTOR-LIKE PROTEIN KINASE-like protein 1.1 isoform X5 [Cinnamomum micranthum f. kanehirae]|uniref:LEAF RUST 10 DISEASE-RESISTANCE LOCUS RECEPTOR-LIKE PROTEIN KINASE-like protein 1.1 isoform X5 n=1 Tax=Cinnamomum micranthum f. kanehirae TaxID=337451 RepID=A0A443P441_9MAGN|nr:LEAF RUST 10 DISEASE-RESISTANCE LOCUS RECEPTOR-LIKE PROTEIN KINASE-like protein 1.1 isoform X5 [Cinnamomum micranthum f. kanehirae]
MMMLRSTVFRITYGCSFQLFPFFLSLSIFAALHSPQVDASGHRKCSPFACGTVPRIQFPFSNISSPGCGIYNIKCNSNKIPIIKFAGDERSYVVKSIAYESKLLTIQDDGLVRANTAQICRHLQNFTVPISPFLTFKSISPDYTFFKCNHSTEFKPPKNLTLYNYTKCEDYVLHYTKTRSLPAIKHKCSVFEIPTSEWIVDPYGWREDLIPLLSAGFGLQWELTHECEECFMKRGGFCNQNKTTGQFICSDARTDKKNITIIGVCAGFGTLLLCSVFFLFWWNHSKHNPSTSSKPLSRAISSDLSLKEDLENGLPTKFFSYKELEEATNNFDPSKELGDGGFGTVYQGMLRDGRNVAVKRLYEYNCKRVEHFKNEISILSRLQHPNLVTLYGCSSRHSRELLIVYEFIPNGTVADHLHGDRATPGAFTWPTRMSIAIETADALKYLHAVDIIHRDVKTTNILIDNNFHVKIADFGLSRLFPSDATHVSTAPQGTPGYVDPDYHQCYQLTDKSDVYSFGVVLMELISSKPAVDTSRHDHEINLACMAISKIHKHALNELVDPTLGFDSDYEVRRMITQVAELAFRCLQDDKEIRPPMGEVLEWLRGIQTEECKGEKVVEVDTPTDDEVLLKKMPPYSPDDVTEAWESRTTTPNTSG